MTRDMKVSRTGMTACPACHAHIRVAHPLTSTICPFCDTSVGDGGVRAERSGLGRVMHAGRAGVVAASLLGMTGLGGCDSASSGASKDGAGTDVVMDIGDQPVYGLPADAFAPDTLEDTSPQPQPAYGVPPADITEDDSASSDAMDAVSDTIADMAVQPVYGLPADAE